MRIKDLNSDIPPLSPDYIVLDAKSFVIKSEYTGEKLFKPYAQTTLTLLGSSYNYISVVDKESKTIVDKIKSVFSQEPQIPYMGTLVELPLKEWKKLLEEYDTILLYYGYGSSSEIFQQIPANRRLKYSPDVRVLDRVISDYRSQHQIKKLFTREEMTKLKRSNKKEIQSQTRVSSFEKKFLDL